MSAQKNELATVPAEPATNMLALIERIALDPSLPLERLERVLDMQERISKKQAETDFDQAMSATQGEMGRISTDAENSQTRSKYATYGKLDKKLRPVYTKNGFALSFGTGQAPVPDQVRVTCHVSHRGGHSRDYYIDMPADGKGAKGGDVMTKTHATGAAASYGMRYLLKMIFNVAIGEEDTDGNGPPAEKINEKQAADLNAMIEELQGDDAEFRARFLAHMRVQRVSDINAAQFETAVKALRNKQKKAK
jgi:hypothetical protein